MFALDALHELLSSEDFVWLATGFRHVLEEEYRWPADVVCLAGVLPARLDALISLSEGRLEDSERHFRLALAAAAADTLPLEEARCHLGLARLLESRGEIGASLTHLDAAGELFARHEAKLYLEQVIAKKQLLRA
jgi:hypothetical protein